MASLGGDVAEDDRDYFAVAVQGRQCWLSPIKLKYARLDTRKTARLDILKVVRQDKLKSIRAKCYAIPFRKPSTFA